MDVSVFWKMGFVLVLISLVSGATFDDCIKIDGTCKVKKNGCPRILEYEDCYLNYTTLYKGRGPEEFKVKFVTPDPARKWLIVSYLEKEETSQAVEGCCGQLEDQACILRTQRENEEFYIYSNTNEDTHEECSLTLYERETEKTKFCDEPGVKLPCIEVRSGVVEYKEEWDDAGLVMKQKEALGKPCLLFEILPKYLSEDENDKQWMTKKPRNVSYNGTHLRVEGTVTNFRNITMDNVTRYWEQNEISHPDNVLCFMFMFPRASNPYCYPQKRKLPTSEDPSSDSALNIIFIATSVAFICFLILVGLVVLIRRIYPSYGEIQKEIQKNTVLRQKHPDIDCKEKLVEENPLQIVIPDQEMSALIAAKKGEIGVPLDDGYHSRTVSISSESAQSPYEDLSVCSGNVFPDDAESCENHYVKSRSGNAEENSLAPGVYIRKKCPPVDAHLQSIPEARDAGFPVPE